MRGKTTKKMAAGILSAAMMATMLTGTAFADDVITVNFWTAPEQYNLELWTSYAEKFNASDVELDGKKVEINVQMMPAQPSSEAGIQNAIATGTVPAISENINRSFANILAESQSVWDISGEDWFADIVAERKIEDTVAAWAIDGSQYVLPLYVNPITLCYNSHALKTLGFDSVPQTTEDLKALLDAYAEHQEELNEEGISHFMYRAELLNSANYWERWFDIEAPYNAFAKGTPLVDGNTLTADRDALQKVFELYGNMGSSLLTGTIDGVWQQETVPVVMGCGLPWEISANDAAGKVYGLDGDYVFGPTLVENAEDVHYNYADSKGLVLYKNDAISDEEHQGAIEFLKFVFTGEGKDTFDIDWLNDTAMLPVRGDLETNESLTAYFDEHPALKDVGSFVADALPGMAHEKGADIMTALGEEAVIPFVNEVAASGGINENPDVSKYVDAAMEAMKNAGGLE
ncbi:MAG: ABC transporter substrate-binding protein [Lachnospiraceae bacterium]|nr:ABC transporter substrate-binding protein [Lachnospiraceae bacterium]